MARERVALAGRPPHGGLAGHTRDVEDALHHRHRGRERQNDDDPKQQRSVVPGPEKYGRDTQQQHPLGALRDPHLGREAKPFGARPRVRSEEHTSELQVT